MKWGTLQSQILAAVVLSQVHMPILYGQGLSFLLNDLWCVAHELFLSCIESLKNLDLSWNITRKEWPLSTKVESPKNMLSSVEFNLLRKSLVMWQINSSSGRQRVGGFSFTFAGFWAFYIIMFLFPFSTKLLLIFWVLRDLFARLKDQVANCHEFLDMLFRRWYLCIWWLTAVALSVGAELMYFYCGRMAMILAMKYWNLPRCAL